MTEKWQACSPEEGAGFLRAAGVPFWISGGWAIDLFLGHETRPHNDLDLTIRRQDQLLVQKHLKGWILEAADPPGSGKLRPWLPGEVLPPAVHNVWCRREGESAWKFELLLCDFRFGRWLYRRNPAIGGDEEEFGWFTEKGLPVIAPEILLLYKSRKPREKDLQDLELCRPFLDSAKLAWLREAVRVAEGAGHSWLALL
jgi:Aminoglycoside-2''-adenylyltransferase